MCRRVRVGWILGIELQVVNFFKLLRSLRTERSWRIASLSVSIKGVKSPKIQDLTGYVLTFSGLIDGDLRAKRPGWKFTVGHGLAFGRRATAVQVRSAQSFDSKFDAYTGLADRGWVWLTRDFASFDCALDALSARGAGIDFARSHSSDATDSGLDLFVERNKHHIEWTQLQFSARTRSSAFPSLWRIYAQAVSAPPSILVMLPGLRLSRAKLEGLEDLAVSQRFSLRRNATGRYDIESRVRSARAAIDEVERLDRRLGEWVASSTA